MSKTLFALLLAFGLATGAQATTRTEHNAAIDHAKATYKEAKAKCKTKSGNDKDVCVKQAKADYTRDKAEADAAYKGTPSARAEAREDEAEADYKLAKEKCDALSGNDKDVCVKKAKADRKKAEADSKVMAKGAGTRSEANRDKREANYKVAKEKCDAMSGDAKDACIADAKAKYGQ